MTVRQRIQYILGVSVATGAVVVLSGSALADSSPVTTTQDHTVSTSTQSVSVDTKAVSVTVSNGDDSTGTSGTGSSPSINTTTTASPSDEKTAPTTVKDDDQTTLATTAGDATVSNKPAVSAATQAAAVPVTTPPAENSATPTPQAVIARFVSHAVAQANAGYASFATVTGLGQAAPIVQQNTNTKAPLPVPAKTNGLLGAFNLVMSATTVPTLHGFLGSIAVATAVGTLLAILLLVFLSASFATFSQLLRRSGYSHAARSDVTVQVPLLSFATPLRMSYAQALCHTG